MKRIAAILVALLACACASDGADIEPMIPQNAAGAFVGMRRGDFTRDMAPDEWWRLYDDRVLDALIAQAFAENRDLAIAAANLRQVRASLQEARSLRFPSTVTSGTAQRVREPALGPIPATETDFFDIGLDISYEVDFFGRVRSIISAARADTEAAEAALDVVRVSVAAETARAYADACAANATIAVAERTARLQQSTLELTQKLLNGGRGTGLSVASAAAQVHTTRATIPPLRAALDEAVFRLATLTGRPPAEASAEARACARIPQLRQPIPVGDGAALLARRPDIRRAERDLAAAGSRVGVARADLFPTVTLGGSIGSTALELGDLGSSPSMRFNIGPLIAWSFPNMLAAQARLERARAGRDGALARFDQVVLLALQETETTLSVYANELDRRATLLGARNESAEAARLARRRFQEGVDSFLLELDAERRLAEAEARLAESEAAVANSQIAVFKALGGGWEHARVSTSPAPARYPHKRRRPGGRRIGRNPKHQRRGTGRPVAM